MQSGEKQRKQQRLRMFACRLQQGLKLLELNHRDLTIASRRWARRKFACFPAIKRLGIPRSAKQDIFFAAGLHACSSQRCEINAAGKVPSARIPAIPYQAC